ncbi:NAD-dependent epimerase/dehydratase family protein [Clostridium sp. PL3]|uniref:NAD-dependent epimerase/dehydratase family protein n=1 Tax=Clostridium thailandense TaxID=2794346 RepID=A0A949TJ74_9CLOT|nr:NAD-dependent epimerase/dehydratase family protein [Clostridium thailandense]MBV7271532.1 NAD-dependent epimerase/dehydratase family protein [Clostridium thailandense]
MNIIIFGAAGFIGTNLVLQLAQDKNLNITLYDRNLMLFKNIKNFGLENLQYVCGEFRIDTNFDELVRDQDIIFNLVSTTVPTTSNQCIPDELAANIVVMAKLLEACVKNKVKKVIFPSSGGTVYGKEKEMPLKEDTTTYPITAYGLQKITIEKLLYLYRYIYGLDYRVIRLANPYGPYQNPNGVLGAVTTFIYKALIGQEITVYGDGSVVRDFIYIDDAVRGILNITNQEHQQRTFNLGCGYGISIRKVIETIQEILKIRLNINYIEGRKVDVPENYLDISLYENTFGKLDPIPLSIGIEKTVYFMRKVYHTKY